MSTKSIENNMNYKYSPIYKYVSFLLIIYMFFKHQKIMNKEQLLLNSIIITLIICLLDYMLINNHTYLFANDELSIQIEKFNGFATKVTKKSKTNKNDDNFDTESDESSDSLNEFDFSNIDDDDYDLSIENDIKSLQIDPSNQNNQNNQINVSPAFDTFNNSNNVYSKKNERQYYFSNMIYPQIQ